MSFISFNKTSDTGAPDGLRINTNAVLFVEASRRELVGQATIHMLGQGSMVNAVNQSIGTVVSEIGGLIAATRHYLASQPDDGASTLYIRPENVSYVRPNLAAAPEFWNIRFIDGSEVRVASPLPLGL